MALQEIFLDRRLVTFTGAAPGEGFPTTHSVAGDVHGDGYANLIGSSWQ
jgi:hypothetical protein